MSNDDEIAKAETAEFCTQSEHTCIIVTKIVTHFGVFFAQKGGHYWPRMSYIGCKYQFIVLLVAISTVFCDLKAMILAIF